MKMSVRRQSSARPTSFEKTKVHKRKKTRGGELSKCNKRASGEDFFFVKAHRNNQCRTLLAKARIREKRRLSQHVTGQLARECEQLCALGRLDRKSSVKTENNVPERWADVIPATFSPFTTESLLRAMVMGIIQPLYDQQGKHACAE